MPNSDIFNNSHTANISTEERTVFVSGLDYRTTEKMIHNYFSNCGEILLLKVPKYKETSKNIGYCHIVFSTREGFISALNKKGCFLDKRYLDIQITKGPQNLPKNVPLSQIKTHTIFVKNLPYSSQKPDIYNYFTSSGKIKDINMLFSKDDSFKGHCYITFFDYKSVQISLQLSGFPFKGRFLKVYLTNDE